MTRKELVKLLEENFAEDEEVKFVYTDDQGDVRGDVQYVDIHKCTFVEGHREWLEIDENGHREWVKLSEEEYHDIVLRKSLKTYDRARLRWVTDREFDDARKCVFIT